MKRLLVLLLGVVFSVNLFAVDESIKESSFKDVQEQIQKRQPTMIEFGANSCYSCKVMARELYKVKKSHPNSNIFYLSVYNYQDIAIKYGVRMIPTQIFLDKNGKVVHKNVGVLKGNNLLAKLTKYEILK